MNDKKRFIPMLILVVVGIIIPLVIKNSFLMQSIVYVVLYMYWASAWNILGGYTGLFALGNGLYIGIGAYVCGILFVDFGITPWVGMIVGGLVSGIISILVGYPVFRLKGMYYSLATIALMSVFEVVFKNSEKIFGMYVGGANGLRFTMMPPGGNIANMQFASKTGYYIVAFVLLIIILLVSDRIQHSKMGYYFRGIRANSDAAASLGVPVLRYKLTSHFISAFFTGIGGALYVATLQFIGSETVFGMDLSFAMIIFCIVGGANTLWGPVIGALILVPVQQIIRINAGASLSSLSSLIYGLVLCIVIMFMPDGILGIITKAISKKKNKKNIAMAAASNGEVK